MNNLILKSTVSLMAFMLIFLLTSLLNAASAEILQISNRTTVSGTVVDAVTGETLAGVNIRVKDRVIGTSTSVRGEYSLTVSLEPPFTLVFSMLGYRSKEIEITESTVSNLNVAIEETAILGGEIVVSASRVEQRTLDSPVSIERIDAVSIRQSAAPSFYESLANLKGVDFSTQSITFKSVNTRGFNANGNTRFVQLIDGIDNQAPGLNFPVGNVVGISELDLESAELMPGVSSALYGPNAINGILLLNSKSPFEYPGLSVSIKTGLNHVDERDDDASFYRDFAIRYANSVNDRFAYKLNASYLKANDFIGIDTRDQGLASFGALERGEPSRGDNRVYDGVNVYGQPLVSLGQIADGLIRDGNAQIAAVRSLIPDGEDGLFTPNGFTESSFVDNTAESIKLNAALHYRLTDNLELLGQYNIGFGSSVYTANDRFILDNFNIWTAKLELRNPNFFARVYTTQEDAGDTYAANTLASLINVETFIPAYFQTFVGARTQGATVDEAHDAARAAGISAQPQPGSQQFEDLADEIRDTPISEGGARFLDKSGMWHGEVMYNFSKEIDPEILEVITGANVRRFTLNSEGTLFALTDDGEEFNIDEFGAYVQLAKGFADDKLRLQGSLRYDKNEFFDGQFSPRISANFNLIDDHNLRISFQRGFRIPTTQNQLIDLDVVTRRLIGNNPLLVNRYNFETNTVYRTESVDAARSAMAAGQSPDQVRQLLIPQEFEKFKTEKVTSFEIGYKSLIGSRFFFDAYYYYSIYDDFIAQIDLTQAVPNGLKQDPGVFNPDSNEGKDAIINRTVPIQRFGFNVNADGNVESHGFAVGGEFNLSGSYTIGANVAFNKLITQEDLIDQGFVASYNTPEWRYNLQFQNRRLTPRLGFNMVYRWQDAFIWESTIGEGVVDAFGTFDAQVSYRLPELNSIVKLSGSNILNQRHTTSLANPSLGAIYMVTFTFDQFLN